MIDNHNDLIETYFDTLYKHGDTANCYAIKALIATFLEDVVLVDFKDYVTACDYDKITGLLMHLYDSIN